MLKIVTASATVALALTLFACSGGTGTIGAPGSVPVETGQLTSAQGLSVEATIASVTLGDECGDGASGAPAQGDVAERCASDESGFAPSRCGGYCQQSNVQIAFTSSDGSAPAKIEILAVTLHDASDGAELDQLEASNPQKWSSSGGYTAWDQTIAPKTELKASYALSSPAWSTMSDPSYSRKFRLRVTVKVDGTQVVLESATLSREPAVAT